MHELTVWLSQWYQIEDQGLSLFHPTLWKSFEVNARNSYKYQKTKQMKNETIPENALTTKVNVAGNLKGWSAAMANKSSPVQEQNSY